MFVDYLEKFLGLNNIIPKKVHERYVSFDGKDCKIRIWYNSRVQIWKKGKLFKQFNFEDKKIQKYL